MNNLNLMNQKVSKKVEYRLKKFCLPLIEHLEISHFYHYMLTDAGGFASVGLNQEWHDCLFSGSDCYLALPQFRDMNNMERQIIFTPVVENEHWQKLAKMATEEFNVHLGLQISFETEDGQEAFGFGLKSADPLKHIAFLNNQPLINNFLLAYRIEFQNSFLKDNLVDVASLIGPSFHKTTKSEKKSSELLGIYEAPNPFTKRETEVIPYLLDGYSAAAIANKLFLSKRTVEHRLEQMKEKMDCVSKSELIRKVRTMETFGYKFSKNINRLKKDRKITFSIPPNAFDL